MNSNVMPSIIQMEEESLRQLVNEVKETIATDFNIQPQPSKNKKFGILDMWKCQRSVRTAVSMRKH